MPAFDPKRTSATSVRPAKRCDMRWRVKGDRSIAELKIAELFARLFEEGLVLIFIDHIAQSPPFDIGLHPPLKRRKMGSNIDRLNRHFSRSGICKQPTQQARITECEWRSQRVGHLRSKQTV